MPTPWRRGGSEKVGYVVVERDGATEKIQLSENPSTTVDGILHTPQARRMEYDSESDDEDEFPVPQLMTTLPSPTIAIPAATGLPTLLITMTLNDPKYTSGAALADNDPSETVVLAIPPPPELAQGRSGGISQTTEHLLIAAGSIGATIIIVMVVLALYTMRKRGLTFSDLITQGRRQIHRGPPPSKYGQDTKEHFDDESTYGKPDAIYVPPPAAIHARSNSRSSQRPVQALGRTDSFHDRDLERDQSADTSFYDDTPSRSNSVRQNDSPTPSSGILPTQGQRQSASTRNTRSLNGDEEPLRYSDPPQPPSNPLPAPPTFRQFLSNRPSASQRPGMMGGGGMASRFSWTNSNAPQTPHDTARDTVAQPLTGRDSYMTSRSSVPRFRTVDSWVNQQSNRVEEARLKQQFRMTTSTTFSDDNDSVPEMPPVPKMTNGLPQRNGSKNGSGLVGRDIKHQRHDTQTTAPIFKAHPGTEVRFSTRSKVPSEILDRGRVNGVLE